MERDIFYCYSDKLHHFLASVGFRYISIGVNKNTNKQYWCYKKSQKLDGAIELYNFVKHVFH